MNSMTRKISSTPTACRLTVDGMAMLGATRHEIMGIRYTDAPGGAAPAAPAATPAAPAPNESTIVPPAAPAADTVVVPINPSTGLPYTPAETQARISVLNGENKAAREAREAAERERDAAQQQTAAVLAALGLKPDGSKADLTPEQLQAQVAERGSAAETTARENLVLRVSPGLAADADKMLDSRSFTDQLSKIKADDKAGVDALVKQWVEDHPEHKLAAPAAAASGGAQHTGTVPTDKRPTKSTAIADRYKSQGAK